MRSGILLVLSVFAFGQVSDVVSDSSDGAPITFRRAKPTPSGPERRSDAKAAHEEADEAFDRGLEFYKRGDWHSAAAALSEALMDAPGDPDILRQLMQAQRNQRALLTRSIETAERSLSCLGDGRCNYFVARVADLMNIPFLRDVAYPGKSEDGVARLANDIYTFLSKAIRNPASGWRAVSSVEAQSFADQGEFVIASALSLSGGSGHVAIVVPSTLAHASDGGSAPWVRDSSTAATESKVSRRANFEFSSHRDTAPLYVLWDPGRR